MYTQSQNCNPYSLATHNTHVSTSILYRNLNGCCVGRLINRSQMTLPNPKLSRVCFSYAAYAKNVINYLYTCNIPVDAALSDAEFSAVESAFNFSFPPDLRSILQEGLPVGPGFPNWRSSSHQQLDILTHLPILGICKQVSKNSFWIDSWGERPEDSDRAVMLAKGFLKKAPVLVPIYRDFYIPSTPCLAGNPVFYVRGGVIRIWSYDIAGFFHRVEFGMSNGEEAPRRNSSLFPAPAWMATEARDIEFWTGLAARAETRGWWSGELEGYLEEVCRRLRDAGWKEEEVREMMMIGGGDGGCDVVELVESPDEVDRSGVDDGDYCFDLRRRQNCDERRHNTISLSF